MTWLITLLQDLNEGMLPAIKTIRISTYEAHQQPLPKLPLMWLPAAWCSLEKSEHFKANASRLTLKRISNHDNIRNADSIFTSKESPKTLPSPQLHKYFVSLSLLAARAHLLQPQRSAPYLPRQFLIVTTRNSTLLVKGLVLGGDLRKSFVVRKFFFRFHKQNSSEVSPTHIFTQNETPVSPSDKGEHYLGSANEERSVKMS